jgi:hypothetical protein
MEKCSNCRKGPCVMKFNGTGFIYKKSIYTVDGNFYIRYCSPVIKEARGDYNVMIRRISDRQISIPLDIAEEG